MRDRIRPGKWVGLQWVYDEEAAQDIEFWKWYAEFMERLAYDDKSRQEVERVARSALSPWFRQPAEIPPKYRTRPMSQAEAGMILKLGSDSTNRLKRREAAAKAVRRRIDSGELRWMPHSRKKLIFDRRQVPDG